MKLVKIFVFNHFFNQQFVLLFLIIAKTLEKVDNFDKFFNKHLFK